MDDNERRLDAWNNAINAEGTRTVFERRAKWLRRKIVVRDFVGIAVPIMLAYVLGSEFFEPLKPYRHYAVGLLAIAALAQVLLVVWSLLSRWDEELAYDIRAARESTFLKDSWKRIGRGDTKNLSAEYELLKNQQVVTDSHDAEKMISDSEKLLGMRAGLIEFQRKCICGVVPTSRAKPWRPQKKCGICGGN